MHRLSEALGETLLAGWWQGAADLGQGTVVRQWQLGTPNVNSRPLVWGANREANSVGQVTAIQPAQQSWPYQRPDSNPSGRLFRLELDTSWDVLVYWFQFSTAALGAYVNCAHSSKGSVNRCVAGFRRLFSSAAHS